MNKVAVKKRQTELIGKRFTKLLVIRKTSNRKNSGVMWECLCDCGGTHLVPSSRLNNGTTKSCGCLAARPSGGKVIKTRLNLSVDRLRMLLSYNPETGVFTRRDDGPGVKAGDKAGWESKMHLQINLDGYRYAVHRLAWLYVYGVWPEQDIDHIDGDGKNNKISNLRDVDKSTNLQNQRKAKCNNKSGFLGVSQDRAKNKWLAFIDVNGKSTALGGYSTPELAHEAYVQAKRQFHKGNTL